MSSAGISMRLAPSSQEETEALSQPELPVQIHETPQPEKALHSRMVQRLHRRYAELLPLLPPGLPDCAGMQTTLAALLDRGHDIGAALRVLRQLVLERLAVLDCDGAAPLQAITSCMTQRAELALDTACGLKALSM